MILFLIIMVMFTSCLFTPVRPYYGGFYGYRRHHYRPFGFGPMGARPMGPRPMGSRGPMNHGPMHHGPMGGPRR